MVTRHDQHLGAQGFNGGQDRIQFLGALNFCVEVPVFASAIGVFEMDEEKVVLVPILLKYLHLLFERLSLPDNIHAHQSREATVHGVDRNCCRFQAVHVFISRNVGFRGKTSQGQTVGFGLVFQKFLGLRNKFGCHFSRPGTRSVNRLGSQRRNSHLLRICILDLPS